MIATLTTLTLPWLATACGPLADPELALPGTVRTASCASSPVNETGSAASADWPVYHHTPDRAGVDVSSPLFRRLAAGWSARLDGPIYASPLLARGLVTNFHGYVVGLPLAKLDGDMEVYTVPTVRQGGIWAPGGVVVMDGGDLLVPVGNTESTNQADYDGGNAVVRLSPDVRPLDFYAPHNWVRLTRTDRRSMRERW